MRRSKFLNEKKKNLTSSKLKTSRRDENSLKYDALNSEINLLVRTINLNFDFKDFRKNKLQSLEKVKYFYIKYIYLNYNSSLLN